jgi:hypothetical protein
VLPRSIEKERIFMKKLRPVIFGTERIKYNANINVYLAEELFFRNTFFCYFIARMSVSTVS